MVCKGSGSQDLHSGCGLWGYAPTFLQEGIALFPLPHPPRLVIKSFCVFCLFIFSNSNSTDFSGHLKLFFLFLFFNLIFIILE